MDGALGDAFEAQMRVNEQGHIRTDFFTCAFAWWMSEGAVRRTAVVPAIIIFHSHHDLCLVIRCTLRTDPPDDCENNNNRTGDR
jgi:hypothetical protein